MMAPICVALALVIATPATTRPQHVIVRAAQTSRHVPAPKAPSELERARKLLTQVKRDPARRRLRHHWERAIGALEKAARGRDTAPALLDAAHARYALYRFSQVDSDRDAALRLASRAQRAGAREAATFAAAIRKEMGEDEGPPIAPKKGATPRATASPAPRSAAPRATASPTPRPAVPPRATASPGPRPPAPPERRIQPEERAGQATKAPVPARGDGETRRDGEEEASTDAILEKAIATAERMTDGEGPAPDTVPAHVSDVRSWSNSDYTRVAIYLSRPIGFTKEELPAGGKRPRRLALDLKPALLGREFTHSVDDGLVKRVWAAQRDSETVRVVLDLAGREDFTVFSLEDPPRLIVDVGVREARKEARASAPNEGEAELTPRRPIRRIIVDAGHGGHDTGATGPTGVREKDVTLAMAKRLAARLRAKGFEVVLTRRGDRYVALEERTAIANARHGDLFVSLHANAHPNRERRGIETYVLNVADDRYAARLAARENGMLAEEAEGQDVRFILSDLNAQSSVEASRRVAESVQHQLCAGIRSRVGDVRDLGVKSALFYVLLGARMPAVLLETSFISNRAEEQRLESARFQEEVANAVTRAVEDFAAREARIASSR
jgi:N-acetylmuramoyl-L-alanine amidase